MNRLIRQATLTIWTPILMILLISPTAAAWETDGLRLRGRMMVRYQVDKDRLSDKWTDTLELQRARFDGRWLVNDDLKLMLEFEFANGFEIRDVYAEYEVVQALKITAGHFKKPFSRLRMTSRWDLVVPRRGLLDGQVIGQSDMFGGFGARDVGLMLSGRVGESVKFRYFLGVFDGFSLVDTFYKDLDDPTEPNASHRDYVARLQLRIVKGLVFAFHYNHKRASVIQASGGPKLDYTYNMFGADIRWKFHGFTLQIEGAYGDNPNAMKGHKLVGGHAIASYAIKIGETLVLTPALMGELLDPDDAVDGQMAVRLAGALNLDIGQHIRIILSAEGGFDEYQWEVPEYITEEDLRADLEKPREVPTRIFLQINVAI
jgi:phosphate-selective porin O/P